MKIRKFPKYISKNYLRRAAVYRRAAGGKDCGYDFSLKALEECYNAETKGKSVSKTNGYYYGKWALDISITTWKIDIGKGDFCKADFYTPITRWYAEPALRSLIITNSWFPHKEALIERTHNSL